MIDAIYEDYQTFLTQNTEFQFSENELALIEFIQNKEGLFSINEISMEEIDEISKTILADRSQLEVNSIKNYLGDQFKWNSQNVNAAIRGIETLLKRAKRANAYPPERILAGVLMHSFDLINAPINAKTKPSNTLLGRIDPAAITRKVRSTKKSALVKKEKDQIIPVKIVERKINLAGN